jgi:hypothetical protein
MKIGLWFLVIAMLILSPVPIKAEEEKSKDHPSAVQGREPAKRPAGGAATAGRKTTFVGSAKARRLISTWFIYRDDKDIALLQSNADIISSISIFGRPSRGFIDACHKLDIETYLGVGGDASAIDTPPHAQATIDGYLKQCEELGLDGIDLDFEQLSPDLQDRYLRSMRDLAERLHAGGKRLSICVGYYPECYADPPKKQFYDALVVGQVCDQVRVMCYDLHWAPAATFGPTSTAPWAKEAMRFWLRYVPREKLIMGLPAYSNDYSISPNGKGVQVYQAKPRTSASSPATSIWLPYEKVRVYRFLDGEGRPHVFFASDEASTKAHLKTVDDLDIPAISFWTYNSVSPETWKVLRDWLK